MLPPQLLIDNGKDKRRLSHGSALDSIFKAMHTEAILGPTIISHTDQHLLELLRRNYDIVTALADIDDNDPLTSSTFSLTDRLSTLQATGDSPRRRNTGDRSSPAMQLRAQRKFGICDDSPGSTSPSSVTDFGIDENDSIFERLKAYLAWFYLDILDAISETNEDLKAQKSDDPPLSAQRLRKDVKRCLIASQPWIETAAGFRDLFIWKSPLSSLMMLIVYSYCVYRGWLFSMVLFLVLLQLIFNYLSTQRNIDLGLDFVPRKEVNMPKMDLSGAQLIFELARKMQLLLGIVADVLEKIRSLFTWRRPETTLRFLVLVAFWLCISLYFTMSTCFTLIGLVLGCKAFLTTYLFHRFPRLRHKLDIIIWFLDRLPTAAESPTIQSPRRMRPRTKSDTYISLNNDSSRSIGSPIVPEKLLRQSMENGELASIASSLDLSDQVKTSRNCVLVDKEQSFPHGMAAGTLFLTQHALIFRYRRSKGNNERDLMTINFDEIWSMEKIHSIKSFSLMPGSGRAIELHMEHRKRPINFIGIAKRDQFFDAITDTARLAGYPLRTKDD